MHSLNNLEILITKEEIEKKVKELSEKIEEDYPNPENLLFIGILKGAFVFLADLIRKINFPVEVDFIELSSYGDKVHSSGDIKVVKGLEKTIKGKDIIIVEDIIDSGHTLSFLLNHIKKKAPKSLKICSLTSKPARRKKRVKIDYLGFKIPNKFVVGYGMDYDGKYRNLPEIHYLRD